MKHSMLVFCVMLATTGCVVNEEDAKFEGSYSNCSWGTDVHECHTFNADGSYSYSFDDEYGDGGTYKAGTWGILGNELIIHVTKIGKTYGEMNDTSGLVERHRFVHDKDYHCIRIGGDKVCKGGSCLTPSL